MASIQLAFLSQVVLLNEGKLYECTLTIQAPLQENAEKQREHEDSAIGKTRIKKEAVTHLLW